MGARLIAKGVDAEAFAFEYAAPVRRGLEGIFFLNGSNEKIARNYASGKPQATIAGSPLVNANYTTFKGMVNYLQTQIAETESMTLFAVVRAAVAAGDVEQLPLFLGSYNTGLNNGVSMFSADPNQVRGSACVGVDDATNVNQTANATPVAMASWLLASVVISPTTISVRSHTHNVSGQATLTAQRRVSPRTIRIGSGYSNAQRGVCDLAVVQINSVAMTEDERTATANDLRAYALRRGITV